MKLVNFINFEPLNDLRRQMRAELDEYSVESKWKTLTQVEMEQLAAQGIDIPLDEVRVLDDGTLAYKNSRVVVYIRDVEFYRSGWQEMPRFHFSDCKTLQDMRQKNRYSRYVVATRDNGIFAINLKTKSSRRFEPQDHALSVCQNCLSKIEWDNFSMGMAKRDRLQLVSSFTLKNFFAKYPKRLISVDPRHTSDTAPINEYPKNFPQISAQLKRARKYYCDDCGLHLEDRPHFLHAHHIDGQKWNSVAENISVVCWGCHAEQPSHTHMKAHPDYKLFMEELGDIWKKARDNNLRSPS